MSKYHSFKATTADGITHDSRKEARRWCELQMMQRAGVISDLQRQVKFVLIPTQTEPFPRFGKRGNRLADGERVVEKECTYIADFVYTENGERVVEDTKSDATKTKEYRIKKKLMLWVHGIKITEV